MIAILSDIHSNLPALQVALRYLSKIGVTRIISLGDQVGYGPWPEECVELLLQHGVAMMMGNHEAMVLGMIDMRGYREDVLEPSLWNRSMLSSDTKEMLYKLPLEVRIHERPDILFVHSEPVEPEYFGYITSNIDVQYALKRKDFKICFFGHSHQSEFYECHMGRILNNKKVHGWLQLKGDHRYLINPGSVGQPRDKDPRTSFMLFDETTNRIRYVRLPYDFKKTQEAIRAAGMPAKTSDRLELGR